MRFSTVLIGILSVVFVQSLIEPDANGRPKKKQRKAKTEEVDATPADDASEEDEAPPSEEASPTGETKSISEQLSDEAGDGEGGMRRSSRMEFDERLVKGQAAKSGAVYLFKRVPRHLPGLVPMRRSYRRRIVQPILGACPLKPARYSFEVEREMKAKKRKIIEEAPDEESAEPEVIEEPKMVPESEPEPPEEKPSERAKKRKKRK